MILKNIDSLIINIIKLLLMKYYYNFSFFLNIIVLNYNNVDQIS